MHHVIAIFLLLLLAGAPSAACLNTYGTALDGEEVELIGSSLEDAVSVYMLNFMGRMEVDMRDTLVADSTRLARALVKDHGYRVATDYAVALIRLGHYSAAARILRDVEREHPGEYRTASNLGTVYELLGMNDRALHWITEGYRRNPGSHQRSEWLHIKILEAKLAIARDPHWLRTHTVLGLDFGSDTVPRAPRPAGAARTLTADSLRAIGDAIVYQLHERILMANSSDPIIADLLTDLGNVLALTTAVQLASEVYKLALDFTPPRADLVRSRIAALEKIAHDHPPQESNGVRVERYLRIAVWGAVAVAIAGIAWFIIRRGGSRRAA